MLLFLRGFYSFIGFWLCWVTVDVWGLFSSCSELGQLLSCAMWASHCGGFSCWGPWSLGWGGFSTWAEWAQLCLGMCIPPGPEMEPMCPALEGEVSTTGLPGMSQFLFQFSSVAQSCPTLCNPMVCSRPGLPGYHQVPEFTQTCDVHSCLDVLFLSPNWEGFVA